ncbi:MAG: DUF87 domain-containing protein [Deltaproteobacteria bacterium]|nr:DUF87 domain-containing protein [Deltaproteobacteria bacterium]
MAKTIDGFRKLHLGTDVTDDVPVYLKSQWLRTGLHILGRTGSGKTRLLLAMFQQLLRTRNATIVVVSPKGALGRMARDSVIAAGQGSRMVIFDPSETDPVPGYNPLRPNGLPVETQARAVRDAVLASFGQTSLDRTQQMARCLTMVFVAAREQGLTLVEAEDLLRPNSLTRAAVIPRLRNLQVLEALRYFDGLRETRQDELAASSLARLQAFTLDPLIRRIVTQQANSLALETILKERRILIADLQLCKPLRLADVKLFGRLLVNDLIAHVFNRPEEERGPVYLLIDEVQLFGTEDLTLALDAGRELGLVPIIAHQYLEQLVLEDDNRKLRASVLNDAVTKLIFCNTGFEDLRTLAPELFLAEFDPYAVKDEITHLELDPIEERRKIVTRTASREKSFSEGDTDTVMDGTSETLNTSKTRGVAHMKGRTRATGVTHVRSRSETDGHGSTIGSGESDGTADSDSGGDVQSEALLYDGSLGAQMGFAQPIAYQEGASSVRLHGHSSMHSSSSIEVENEMHADTKAKARAFAKTRASSRARSVTEADTAGTSDTVSQTFGRTKGYQQGHSFGKSISVAETPWYRYAKRRATSSRTFWTVDEHLNNRIIEMMRHATVGTFVLKVPTKPAVMIRAPHVKDPKVRARLVSDVKARMHALPFYSRPEDADAEERARLERLTEQVSTTRNATRLTALPPGARVAATQTRSTMKVSPHASTPVRNTTPRRPAQPRDPGDA